MKRLLYITMFLMSGIWLSSCGSHKSTMKQESFIQKEDSTRQVIDFGYTSMQDITSFLKSATNKKMNWKLYDTNKPKDPVTGKHPLLAEGDAEENNEIEQNTNTSVADSAALKSDNSSSSWSQENDKREEQSQKDETTIPKQISGLVWALIALVTVAWLIYRKFKK